MKSVNGNINTDPDNSIDNDKNTVYNRRIEHATIATVANSRFTTKYTLDIHPEKPNSVINSAKIHQTIFGTIKNMDDSATIITHDNTRITDSNIFPTDKEYNIAFSDQRLCNTTKRVYISFTLESKFNLS